MILSPAHRFIFIHVPKAAGTSLNSALSRHDVFYPARGQDRAARVRCAANAGIPAAAADLSEHASAKQFIDALGRADYDRYFTIAFVRNPWDVAVSWFHYRLITSSVSGFQDAQAAGNFDTYVRKVLTGPDAARRAGLQYPYVVDENGQLAVSFLGRYESLAADFAQVKERLGIETLDLDHFNQSYHPPWTQLYTSETFEMVGALVGRDAELFGYSSDPADYGIR